MPGNESGVGSIAVVGCGVIGASWAALFLARGFDVAATDTPQAPWYVARTDDKRRGRLNVIRHILDKVPYEELPREKFKLPKRQKRGDYVDPGYPYKYVKEHY